VSKILVACLGMIGGSWAKALKKYTNHFVYGFNRNSNTLNKALDEKAIDAIITKNDFGDLDFVFVGMFPRATFDYLKQILPYLKRGCIICDLVGVKEYICTELGPLCLEGHLHFVGGHPMAGLAKAGYIRSDSEMFQKCNMLLCETVSSNEVIIKELEELCFKLGFKTVEITTPSQHDQMIAHTSQLAHIVANSYMRSDKYLTYHNFIGGSYKDMTRVATLDENLWHELLILNKENIVNEIDGLILRMNELKQCIKEKDHKKLQELLQLGRIHKEELDALN